MDGETLKSWLRFYVELYWLVLLAFVILILALVVFAFTYSSIMFPFVLVSLWYISVRGLHYHQEQKAANDDRSPKDFATVYHVYTYDASYAASLQAGYEAPDNLAIPEYRILDFSRNLAVQIPVIGHKSYPYVAHVVSDDGALTLAGMYDLYALASGE